MKQKIGLPSMGLFKRFIASQPIRIYFFKIVFVSLCLTLIVYGLLQLIDLVLVNVVVGYQTAGSYFFGASIFFVASLFSFYFSVKYRWNQALPFFSIAIAVYFPLVLLSSLAKIYLGIPLDVYSAYMESFCLEDSGSGVCGEALAHMVFSMAIRALPLVLTIPYLYWVALKYLNMTDPQDHIDG